MFLFCFLSSHPLTSPFFFFQKTFKLQIIDSLKKQHREHGRVCQSQKRHECRIWIGRRFDVFISVWWNSFRNPSFSFGQALVVYKTNVFRIKSRQMRTNLHYSRLVKPTMLSFYPLRAIHVAIWTDLLTLTFKIYIKIFNRAIMTISSQFFLTYTCFVKE